FTFSICPPSIDEAGARRLIERGSQRAIFVAVGAADLRDAAEVIFGLLTVALLDLPEAVIIPSQDVVRVVLERALVPDLGELIVAELAIGIADQVGDVGVVVMAERLELIDGGRVIVAVIDRRVGRMITLNESGIVEERLLGSLLAPMGRTGGGRFGLRLLWLRIGRRCTHDVTRAGIASTSTSTSASGGKNRHDGACELRSDEKRERR